MNIKQWLAVSTIGISSALVPMTAHADPTPPSEPTPAEAKPAKKHHKHHKKTAHHTHPPKPRG